MDCSAGGKHVLLAMPNSENILINSLSDMDVIASSGLVIKDTTRNGIKKYILTQAAYDAVDSDFLNNKEDAQSTIGVQIMGNVSGGSIQGVGYLKNSDIEQIINDPDTLHSEIEKISAELIEKIRKDLSEVQLSNYIKTIEDLKAEFKKENQKESGFRKIISSLSFINDTTASFQLISKVLPYVLFIIQYIDSFLTK